MKGSKYMTCIVAGSFLVSMLGGCSSNTGASPTETTVVMSESGTETAQESENEKEEAGPLTGDYDAEDLEESWSEGKASIIKCNGSFRGNLRGRYSGGWEYIKNYSGRNLCVQRYDG